MHIPTGSTLEMDILPFETAISMKADGFDAEKWIYVPPVYTEYRYILGTKGKKPLICIGINPSTAEPGNLDNTLKSVERIALHNGYDSFIMFNVYPQRATNPDDMDKTVNETLVSENLRAFRHILSLTEGGRPAVWASWGTIIEKRPYLVDIVREMIDAGNEYGAIWYSVGQISKKGHPHHPLYLKKDAVPELFDVAGYCELLKSRMEKKS